MARSQKDRKGGSNSRGSRFTREGEIVKSERWQNDQSSERNETSGSKNVKGQGVERSW